MRIITPYIKDQRGERYLINHRYAVERCKNHCQTVGINYTLLEKFEI
jgi:hypothetical protein